MDWFLIFQLFIIYILLGYLFAKIMKSVCFDLPGDSFVIGLCLLLWPIALPLAIGYFIVSLIGLLVK